MNFEVIPDHDDDEISLVDLAAVLWRRRALIVVVTVLAAIGSVVYALSLPNKYSSQVTIMPLAAEKGSPLSQYAGMAQLAGIALPGGTTASPVMKIQAILRSRTLAERLVADLQLGTVLAGKQAQDKKGHDPDQAALDAVRNGIFSVSVDEKTGLIKVSAITEDPTLSRDIATRGVFILESILGEKALTVSAKTIKILESQVAEQEKKVRDLQAKITAYQARTRMLSPTGQVQQSMALYSSLINQRIALEVEISRLENVLSSDNPKITNAKTQIEAVKRQIANLEKSGLGVGPSLEATPAAMVEYVNLSAELEMNTKIYANLAGNLEGQRLQKTEEAIFIEIIDPAVVPTRKSEPSRSMIAVVGTVAGGMFAVLLAFVLDALRKLTADPEVRKKFGRASRAVA